jgi:hypothetical protein
MNKFWRLGMATKTDKKIVETVAVAVIAAIVVISAAVIVAHYSSQSSGQETQAINLITSAENYFSQASLCLNENDFVGTRTKLAVVESNVTDAKNLLAGIESSTKQYCLDICDFYSNCSSTMDVLSYGCEHLNQALARINDNDWSGAVSKLLDAEDELTQAQSYFLLAGGNLNSIDMTALSLELKNSVTEAQALFDEYKTLLPDLASAVDALVPVARGCDHLFEGLNYVLRYDWHAAKVAFEDSLPYVSESENKFDNLRYCKTSYVSSLASEMFAKLVPMESALPHLIQGCGYAEAGDMSSANSEFDTANNILK